MKTVLALSLLATAAANGSQARGLQVAADNEGPRVALVIGNSSYRSGPLKNAVSDARLMAETLREIGFDDVTLKTNLSQRSMKQAINEFGRTLYANRGVGLFYYAGHGMQVDGRNYLIPVDAEPTSEEDVDVEGVALDRVLGKMSAARNPLNIVVLDACRNNPFSRSFRSAQSGLAFTDAPKGTMIVFATAPGQVAADGSGGNSPFTQALSEQMKQAGLQLEEVIKATRARVAAATRDVQIPWNSSSVTGRFYFVPPPPEDDLPVAPSSRFSGGLAAGAGAAAGPGAEAATGAVAGAGAAAGSGAAASTGSAAAGAATGATVTDPPESPLKSKDRMASAETGDSRIGRGTFQVGVGFGSGTTLGMGGDAEVSYESFSSVLTPHLSLVHRRVSFTLEGVLGLRTDDLVFDPGQVEGLFGGAYGGGDFAVGYYVSLGKRWHWHPQLGLGALAGVPDVNDIELGDTLEDFAVNTTVAFMARPQPFVFSRESKGSFMWELVLPDVMVTNVSGVSFVHVHAVLRLSANSR